MKRLNRKGYMTIEIILASVITFVIAFFLIDLTMKLVDTTDNAYADTSLITDKGLIIKNIRSCIEENKKINGDIVDVVVLYGPDPYTSDMIEIVFTDNSISTLSIEDNIIKYTDSNGNVVYSKEIHDSLGNVTLGGKKTSSYVLLTISGENVFLEEDYDMNIIVYNVVP